MASAWRYEFYAGYDLPRNVEDINRILDSFRHLYNYHRPHGSLQHLPKLETRETSPSFGTVERSRPVPALKEK